MNSTTANTKTQSLIAQLEKEKQVMAAKGKRAGFGSAQRDFLHQLSAVVFARAIFLYPLERIQICMQVGPAQNYINKLDKPKNMLDLVQKINSNQGSLTLWRGMMPLMYKLSAQYGLRFAVYEHVMRGEYKNVNNSYAAATAAAVALTLATYPLDLAQGLMASDMSKKASLQGSNRENQKQRFQQNKAGIIDGTTSYNKPDKVYTSVRDVYSKTSQSGQSVYKGVATALITQIPYSIILFNSFEFCNKVQGSQEAFHKYDELSFAYKFAQRFGAATLSMTLACALTYPLDTLKRRMQVDNTYGYSKTSLNDIGMARQMYAREGWRSFYRGFSTCLARNVPLAFLQYTVFQNFRFISSESTAQKQA